MPSQQEYRANIYPLLSDGLSNHLSNQPDNDTFAIDALADHLGGVLEEIEKQHMGAVANLNALVASEESEPWEGDGELSFLLYFLHYPPSALREEIESIPPLKVVWDAMVSVAAPAAYTPTQFNALSSSLPASGAVKCNEWGDIYGTNKYEQLDPGWAWTLKNDLMNHLPKWLGNGFGRADFKTFDWSAPVSLKPNSDCSVRIAIIGDWGTGKYPSSGLTGDDGPAIAVMDTMSQLSSPPDYIIHLGDTYYSGTGSNRTPKNEEINNLTEVLKLYPNLVKSSNCFTLNSNHEMYGGAYGYYQQAISDPIFAQQQNCSYFALEFGDWIIAGLDSAYFDPSVLYMDGGLGDPSKNPQYQFLSQLASKGKQVILLSHHTGLSTDGAGPSKYLWDDVNSVITPSYWYWGHIHLGAVYSANAYSGNMNARCIGHSAMPFAIPPGMAKCTTNVDWYSNTPLEPKVDELSFLQSSPRAKNGFAMLTLTQSGITEEIYNIGSTVPVWQN